MSENPEIDITPFLTKTSHEARARRGARNNRKPASLVAGEDERLVTRKSRNKGATVEKERGNVVVSDSEQPATIEPSEGEVERIEREALIEILKQWYAEVVIDEENSEVFLRSQPQGKFFSVEFDELQRLIDMNESREVIGYQELLAESLTKRGYRVMPLKNGNYQVDDGIRIREMTEDDINKEIYGADIERAKAREIFDAFRKLHPSAVLTEDSQNGFAIQHTTKDGAMHTQTLEAARQMLDDIRMKDLPRSVDVIESPVGGPNIVELLKGLRQHYQDVVLREDNQIVFTAGNQRFSYSPEEAYSALLFAENSGSKEDFFKPYKSGEPVDVDLDQKVEKSPDPTPPPPRPPTTAQSVVSTSPTPPKKTTGGGEDRPFSTETPPQKGGENTIPDEGGSESLPELSLVGNDKESSEPPRSSGAEGSGGMRPPPGEGGQYELDLGDEGNRPLNNEGPLRDPYWDALNQHISPENYAKFGIVPPEPDDAYWRAQKLTMSPEWANVSNEELLKKFEESRKGGGGTLPSVVGSPEVPVTPDTIVDFDPTVEVPGYPGLLHGLRAFFPDVMLTPDGKYVELTIAGSSRKFTLADAWDLMLQKENPGALLEDLKVRTDGVDIDPTESNVDIDLVKLEAEASKRKRFEGGMKRPEVMERLRNTLTEEGREGRNALELEQIQKQIVRLERDLSEVSTGSPRFRKYVQSEWPGDAEFAERSKNGATDAYYHMWAVKKLAELKQARSEAPRGKETFYDTRFDANFGIRSHELESLPGYANLDEGKRTLLFENLQAYANQGDGFMKNAWNGFMAQAGVKHEGPPPKGTRSFDAYKRQLQLFMRGMQGISVHVEEGHVMPDFVGVRLENDEVRKLRKPAVDALNAAAHAFSHIPGSWQEDGTGVHDVNESRVTKFFKELPGIGSKKRKQFREYQAHQEAFAQAKREFAERMLATGMPQEAVIRALLAVDNNVHISRFIETNPDAIATLEENVDEPTAWKIGEYVGKGGYVALGVISKRFGGALLGIAAGPILAGAIAVSKEWNKKAALQRESDRQRMLGHPDDNAEYNRLVAQMKRAHQENPKGKGYEDATKALRQYENKSSALNMVPARTMVETGSGSIDRGITAKLHDAVREYERYQAKDESYVRKNKYKGEVHLKKSDKALENLLARIQYAEDKFNLNRIQFGSGADYALNMTAFREALDEAKIVASLRSLGDIQTERATRLGRRLGSKLDRKEALIVEARKGERLRETYNWETWKATGLAAVGVSAEWSGLTGVIGEKTGISNLYKDTAQFFKNAFTTPPIDIDAIHTEARAVEEALGGRNEFGLARGVDGTVYQVGTEPVPVSQETTSTVTQPPPPEGSSGGGGEVAQGDSTRPPETPIPSYEGGREDFDRPERVIEAPTTPTTPTPSTPERVVPPSPSEILASQYQKGNELLGRLIQTQFEPARWSDLKGVNAAELTFDRLGGAGPQFDAERERVAGLVQQMSTRYGRPPLENESVEAYLGRMFRSEATTPKGLNSLTQYVESQMGGTGAGTKIGGDGARTGLGETVPPGSASSLREYVKVGDRRPALLSTFLESGAVPPGELARIKNIPAALFEDHIRYNNRNHPYPPEFVRFGKILYDMKKPPYNMNLAGKTVASAMEEAHALMVAGNDRGLNTRAIVRYLEEAQKSIPKGIWGK